MSRRRSSAYFVPINYHRLWIRAVQVTSCPLPLLLNPFKLSLSFLNPRSPLKRSSFIRALFLGAFLFFSPSASILSSRSSSPSPPLVFLPFLAPPNAFIESSMILPCVPRCRGGGRPSSSSLSLASMFANSLSTSAAVVLNLDVSLPPLGRLLRLVGASSSSSSPKKRGAARFKGLDVAFAALADAAAEGGWAGGAPGGGEEGSLSSLNEMRAGMLCAVCALCVLGQLERARDRREATLRARSHNKARKTRDFKKLSSA